MAGINTIILVGNLGKDPEVRYAQSGIAVCKLRLAVTERVKDGTDGWKDATEWFTITTFGKTAESAALYLHKGRQVYVEGRLKSDKYKDKEGIERTSIEVIANNLQYLGSGAHQKGKNTDNETPTGADTAPAAAAGFVDDDLPF